MRSWQGERLAVLVGRAKGRGAVFLCDVDAGSCRRSKLAKSVSVHQSRNTAGRASPYGSLHRGIPYYVAPTLPALQTHHERLAATLPCAAGSVCMLLLLAAASQQPRGQ